MQIVESFGQLLFPIRCYGCGAIGISICSLCRTEWSPHLYSLSVGRMPVHSSILYSPIASKIVLAAKENGLRGADTLIVESIMNVLVRTQLDIAHVCLVPIPSSALARRRRGRSFIVDIVNRVSLELSVPMSNSLELTRKVRDQSGLHAKARAVNMEGAFALKVGAYPRGNLILVDDVVTTGATLREAARALTSQGLHVLGSVTACVAQPLRYKSSNTR